MTSLKLLVDRNIRVHAQIAEFVTGKQEVNWAGGTTEVDILGYRGKKPRQGEWLSKQISALPTIARLAREGRLVLCTSREIQFEGMFGAIGTQGSIGDVFRDHEFQHVPPAVDRSYFSASVNFNKYASGEEQVKWYKDFLLKVDESAFLEKTKGHLELPKFDQANFENLGRFREICRNLNSDDQIRDAFHLWTAEVNGLNYFLTADKRFINAVTVTAKLELSTPPISASSLLERLGIKEPDPLPIGDQRFRFLFEPDN